MTDEVIVPKSYPTPRDLDEANELMGELGEVQRDQAEFQRQFDEDTASRLKARAAEIKGRQEREAGLKAALEAFTDRYFAEHPGKGKTISLPLGKMGRRSSTSVAISDIPSLLAHLRKHRMMRRFTKRRDPEVVKSNLKGATAAEIAKMPGVKIVSDDSFWAKPLTNQTEVGQQDS